MASGPFASYYRITGDFWDNWEDYTFFDGDPHLMPPCAGVLQLFRQGAKFAAVAGINGTFPDFDGMPLGQIGCGKKPHTRGSSGTPHQSYLTRGEQRTALALVSCGTFSIYLFCRLADLRSSSLSTPCFARR